MTPLAIYLLNVGQADTSVIQTPAGNIIVIDAVSPKKLTDLLNQLRPDGEIAQLIITHPHDDHYGGQTACSTSSTCSGSPWLLLAGAGPARLPCDHQPSQRAPGAHSLSVRLRASLSRRRHVPDYEDSLLLELLGPSNNTLDELARSNTLDPNHLSIISRLCYGTFSMVFAADAQMENWQHYDEEGLLEKKCTILRRLTTAASAAASGSASSG